MSGIFIVASWPASAALIASLDTPTYASTVTLPNDIGKVPAVMYQLTSAGLASFETTIPERTSSATFLRNGSFYFTTELGGLLRQARASTTTSTVTAGWGLSLRGASPATLVTESDLASFTNIRSFIRNLKTGSSKALVPTVSRIWSVSFSPGGTAMAMIATNDKGQRHLYTAHGSLASLKEYPLPGGATACDALTLSPDTSTVAVDCFFGTLGTKRGIAFVQLRAGTVVSSKRSIVVGYYPLGMAWVSRTTLVTGGSTATSALTTGRPAFREYRLTNGRPTSKALTVATPTVPSYASPEVSQIVRNGEQSFYYTLSYYGINPQTQQKVMGSAIGSYHRTSKANAVIVNDGKFNYFTETGQMVYPLHQY